MEQVVERMASRVVTSRYGLATHSTGIVTQWGGPLNRLDALREQVDAGAWALATVLWMGAGLAGVVLAARRYQER